VHNDILGSPIMETNAKGAIVSSSHYRPFGSTIEAPKDDVGYTGHLKDIDLGLTYMQARYYDQDIGRFYSNDPVGFLPSNLHSFGRYTYANNNPYKYTDPDGRWGIQVAAGLIGFAIGAVSEIVTNENATFGSTMQAGGVGAAIGVATTFGGGLVGTMAVGGAANGAGELATQVMNGESIDPVKIGVAGAVGTIGGGLAKGIAAKAVPKRGIGSVSKTSANHNSAPGRTPRTMEGGASEIVDGPKRAISEVKQGAAYSTGAVGGREAATAINEDET
jgi:RHS repeat-associated protein